MIKPLPWSRLLPVAGVLRLHQSIQFFIKALTAAAGASRAPRCLPARSAIQAVVLAILAVLCVADQAQAAGQLNLDPQRWRLVIAHNFIHGDRPALYSKYCGAFGVSTAAKRATNFSPDNVYWSNGALVLKFERRRNRSCTGRWANYAGGGISVNTRGYKDIAVEMEIAGNSTTGSHAYATTWPKVGQRAACGWGAEDDFFEQVGRMPRRLWASNHTWTSGCGHKVRQFWYDVPTFNEFHHFAVVRDTTFDAGNLRSAANRGCVTFYVDGVATGWTCDGFRPMLMGVGAGIGAQPQGADGAKLPTTIRIRKIKVWKQL